MMERARIDAVSSGSWDGLFTYGGTGAYHAFKLAVQPTGELEFDFWSGDESPNMNPVVSDYRIFWYLEALRFHL